MGWQEDRRQSETMTLIISQNGYFYSPIEHAIEHTIPKKLQICYAGYFGHIQAHSPKTGKFFEILDEGISTSKKFKKSIKSFLKYCISKNSAI